MRMGRGAEMNKVRRKKLNDIADQMSALKDALFEVQQEEQEAMDNTPESLQGTEAYEAKESNVATLEGAIDALDQAIGDLTGLVE